MQYERLTTRNKKIWRLLKEGRPVKEIAKMARCGAKEVYSMRYRMNKIGALTNPVVSGTVISEPPKAVDIPKKSFWQKVKDAVFGWRF
jgi:DNA-binding CsgD family transcriptional regulator